MKYSLLKIAPVCLLVFCFFANPVQANEKTEAKKKIHAFHQKAKEASNAGDLQAAIDAAEQALGIALETFGDKSRETAEETNNVANLYMFAGFPAEAEALYKKAILIESKHLGKKDLALADSFYNLAMAYAMQKKYQDARIMLKKAYEIRVRKLGENHPDTLEIRQAQEQIYTESSKTV